MKIKRIKAFGHLSSLGNETIKLILTLENNITSSISVPLGISAGKYEAPTVVSDQAQAQIESIKTILFEGDWQQETLDKKLTELRLAGNASLAISAAFWKATSVVEKYLHYQKFPKLCVLLFEGGKHGNKNLTIQEFMIIENSLGQAIEDFRKMRKFLVSQKIETTVGVEGGFSPIGFTNRLALEAMKTVFPKSQFALDLAGSFKEEGRENYDTLFSDYNIYYLEDPYSDGAWAKWSSLFQRYGKDKLIVGDDLTVTSPERLKKAIQEKAINSVIIKPNQNGTISGALETAELARKNGLKIVVSHRGEDTNDDWIVDFALCVKADFVKFGGINRGERVAKYNRLLELGMQ